MTLDPTPLAAHEISFFKRHGYLIKRRAIDRARCDRALDRMWESAPASIRRDDPETWRPVPASEASDDPLLTLGGSRWQLRAAGTEAALVDIVWNAPLKGWAEQLLGAGSLRPPRVGGQPMGSWGAAWPGGPVDPQLGEGVRGIYATLPEREALAGAGDHLHTDGHPFHLGVVCLLSDCPADSGAFRVWPDSHRRFYPLFQLQYDQARAPYYPHLPSLKGILYPPAYLEEVGKVEADTPSVDCHGAAGDVVFWHHRLGHMAGRNLSDPPHIRQALLYDFCKTDLDQTRLDPPQADMWRDWSEEVRTTDADIPPQFAAEQMLPLPLLGHGAGIPGARGG
jgi:hypothetical protein